MAVSERRRKSAVERVRRETAEAVGLIRSTLGLGQGDVARLCGVSAGTVRA